MKTNPTNLLSIIISTLKTIRNAYFTKSVNLDLSQNGPGWNAPDGKLYLWAMSDTDTQITLSVTDAEEIEYAGIYTRELTTPEGLTIIIAEDF